MPPKKIGRPPSENPKSTTIRIRVDDETLNKLDGCAKALESNRSDVVRKGIDLVDESLKK